MEEGQNPQAAEPDDFDRQLRALTSGQAGEARFKELSADERARQAARARRHGARQAARARRAAARQARSRQPGRWRARTVARTAVTLVVLGIVASALYALGLRPSFLGSTHGPGAGQRQASAPGPSGTPAFTAADPFAGTPAQQYSDGAAGITPPAASPVGGYSAAQVATAYATTRRLLIAANLDQVTLNGGTPSAFAALLAPQLRTYFLRGLNRRGTDTHGSAKSTRSWVVSFAPGTELVGSVIKVDGIMIATTATDSGRPVLRILFDYLFVYPVQRPGQPATRMRIVAHPVGSADFAKWNDPGGPLQVWWLSGGNSGAAGSRCDAHDGFVHPDFPLSPPDKVRPSGAPVDPYDLNPPGSRAGCQATTGT